MESYMYNINIYNTFTCTATKKKKRKEQQNLTNIAPNGEWPQKRIDSLGPVARCFNPYHIHFAIFLPQWRWVMCNETNQNISILKNYKQTDFV